jgi:glycosyltransferase involved in cell wall biosynthesis
MKRILHIIPSLAAGGAERQLANLVSHTSAEISHFVCVFKDAGFFAPTIRASGHEICELGISGKHPWFSAASKLRHIINNYKPDIIKTWLYDANIVGRLVQIFNPKIPIITTLHTLEYEPETIRAANWSPYKIEGLRQIDKITTQLTKPHFAACSQYVKKSFQKRLNLPESQMRVIYNGINPGLLECAADEPQQIRRDLNIPKDAFVYVTVGRIDAMKNHALLLRAFPKVLLAVPQAYLTIVGMGVLEQELKDLANLLGIAQKVRFLGRRKDVGACLEMANVFVFPTLSEGHPLALVEAMFKKLPSIASNIEVLREVLTDNENGLLFNPNEPNDLAMAMIKLYRKPELRERLSRQALQDAERRFHIRLIASEWEDYYRFVMGETGKDYNAI